MAETKINYDKMNHFIANPEWTLQEMTKQYKERAHVYDKVGVVKEKLKNVWCF